MGIEVKTDLIAAKRSQADFFASHINEMETTCRLPGPVVDTMKNIGIFRMFVPRAHGGLELELPSIVNIIVELGLIDASISWSAMIGAGSALFATMLPRNAYERIYSGKPDTIMAGSTQLLGTARRCAEGWHVEGRWPFASGCLQADWMLGFCKLLPDGRSVDGNPEARVVVLPASRWMIENTWRVPGLKGTGSHHIAFSGKVSAESGLFEISSRSSWASGPLYTGVPQMIALLHGAVSLGIAEGAIRDLLALASSGHQQERSAAPMGETEAFQTELGRVHANVRAARSLLSAQAESHWHHAQAGTLATDANLVQGSQTAIWVVGTCRRAVDACFALGGSAAIYDNSSLQRRMRDIHVAAQHNLMQPRHYIKSGKLLVDTAIHQYQ